MTLYKKLIFSVLLLSVQIANAREQMKPKADFDVREIQSQEIRGEVFRAIKGYSEIYPYLVIERIKLPLTEGSRAKLVSSWNLKDIAGVSQIVMKEGDNIDGLKWKDNRLTFKLSSVGNSRQCKIFGLLEGKPQVECKKL